MKELARTGGFAADMARAFDASPNPYVLLSPDLVIEGANQAYLEVTGRSRGDIVGRGMFDAFDPGPTAEGQERKRQLQGSFDRVLGSGEKDHLALIHYPIAVVDDSGQTVVEDRYWSATHTPLKDEAGRIVYILQHTSDITELHSLRTRFDRAGEARTALDAIVGGEILQRARSVQADNTRLETERNRLLDMFRQAPGFVAVLNGPEHVFQMHNPAYAQLIGHRELQGRPIRDALPELAGQGYFELLDRVYKTGQSHQGEASLVQLQRTADTPLEDVYLNFIYQPILDPEGGSMGIFVQGHDVTETVLAADRQKLMIDELNHRVKNTLATVQSIAMQTARSNPEPARFAEAFQARLMALSHTHDLLTRSHWEGAGLHDVLEHETDAHGSQRISPTGPRLALEPPAALALGMIFHELATNAAKYGALSAAAGRVHVDWSLSHDPRRLVLIWREIGGPPAVAPERKGFGSRLIERSVRHDLAGEVKLDYASSGFSAEISIPLEKGRA